MADIAETSSEAPDSPEGQTQTPETIQPGAKLDEQKVVDLFKARVESSKRHKRQFYAAWKRNVELRIGKIASQYTGGVGVEDEIQSEINPDWSLTKTKTANL